ncbi:uncharacterized protein LOC132740172 [Ruditapes philippinarum]|uniref:uncharacterized protein LOC132740172 n=1 Tax=Ruditapes philippinarum TaxID=129788 RepID=UPI00295AC167|nr:uncharacterized protein LOC132740172 [Ruditapes philippinarum]
MFLPGVLVLFIVNAINGASIEPICSKFSYEEQLLEKMVRLEFFAENMQKDVKTSITDSKKEINGMIDKQLEMSKNMTDFSATMADFELTFGELKENVKVTTEATLKGLSEKVEMKFAEFKKNITSTNDNILKGLADGANKQEQKFERFMTNITSSSQKILKETTEEVKKSVTETMAELINKKHPLVAFNVYGTDSEYTGKKVPFKKIRLNEGGGFSTTTSMFTAPVSGLYQFNAHICLEKAVETDYYLQVGDTKLARGEYVVPNAATDGKCMSVSSVALVRESQTAYVGGISSSASFVNNDDLNSFSGVLIRAT